MITWVLYDIQNDRARNRVAKICKQNGLYRVQLSCFLGLHLMNIIRHAGTREIEPEINSDIDKVYIFPMSRSELRSTVLLGQAFDKQIITDEVRALFF